MQSLGTGMQSIIGSFTNIGSFENVDIEEISEHMVDGISAMLAGIDGIDLGAIPSIYEIAPAVKALVGSMEGVADLNNVDIEDVMDGMSEGIENMMDTMGDIEPESISKFVKLSEALSTMSLSGSGIDVAFDGIKSLASQDFVDGLSRATSAIYDFAYALLALSNVDEVDGNIVSTEGVVGDTTPQTSGVFDTDSEQSTTDFDQLARYSGGAFGRSAGEANTPLVVETLANVGQSGGSTDMSNVEAKLSELIGLMKSGGIAVNLDGKKVHKGLASSIESNPIS